MILSFFVRENGRCHSVSGFALLSNHVVHPCDCPSVISIILFYQMWRNFSYLKVWIQANNQADEEHLPHHGKTQWFLEEFRAFLLIVLLCMCETQRVLKYISNLFFSRIAAREKGGYTFAFLLFSTLSITSKLFSVASTHFPPYVSPSILWHLSVVR